MPNSCFGAKVEAEAEKLKAPSLNCQDPNVDGFLRLQQSQVICANYENAISKLTKSNRRHSAFTVSRSAAN